MSGWKTEGRRGNSSSDYRDAQHDAKIEPIVDVTGKLVKDLIENCTKMASIAEPFPGSGPQIMTYFMIPRIIGALTSAGLLMSEVDEIRHKRHADLGKRRFLDQINAAFRKAQSEHDPEHVRRFEETLSKAQNSGMSKEEALAVLKDALEKGKI